MGIIKKLQRSYMDIVCMALLVLLIIEFYMQPSKTVNIPLPNGHVLRIQGKAADRDRNSSYSAGYSSSQQNTPCRQKIRSNLDNQLTDKLLRELTEACLPRKELTICGNSSEFLFGKDSKIATSIFKHVTCPDDLIGPPSKQQEMVALASFNGAGNTWVRHLVEQISGIQTGSLYNGMIQKTFHGESKCPTNDTVFLVKTHEFGASNGRMFKPHCRRIGLRELTFTKAVYLLRNPFNTLVANFNHDVAGKIDSATMKSFTGIQWKQFVAQKSTQWLHHVSWWLGNFKGPVHVLVYDQLVDNPTCEMYKLFKFLDKPVSTRAMSCLSEDSEGEYHRVRKTWMRHDDMFVPQMASLLVDLVNQLTPLFDKHNISSDVIRSYYRYNENK